MSGDSISSRGKPGHVAFWITLTRRMVFECSTCNHGLYGDMIDESNEYSSSRYGSNKPLYTVDLPGNSLWYGSRPSCDNILCHFEIELDYENGVLYDLQQDYELYRV
jgi:hypothetical protein